MVNACLLKCSKTRNVREKNFWYSQDSFIEEGSSRHARMPMYGSLPSWECEACPLPAELPSSNQVVSSFNIFFPANDVPRVFFG
jgi:hypothetical protein